MTVNEISRESQVDGTPHVRDGGISAASNPGVHGPTAIVDCNVVGQDLG